MDISDFMDGGEPMAYEKAKVYFAQDPSQKCETYLCLFGLISECHEMFY